MLDKSLFRSKALVAHSASELLVVLHLVLLVRRISVIGSLSVLLGSNNNFLSVLGRLSVVCQLLKRLVAGEADLTLEDLRLVRQSLLSSTSGTTILVVGV